MNTLNSRSPARIITDCKIKSNSIFPQFEHSMMFYDLAIQQGRVGVFIYQKCTSFQWLRSYSVFGRRLTITVIKLNR